MIQVCDPPRQRQVRRLSAEEFFTLVRCGGAGFYRPRSEVLRMLTAGEAWGTAGAALLVLPLTADTAAAAALRNWLGRRQLEGGCHHTAAMHSRNIDNMNQMANAIDTSIFVKNGPCIAGLGLGGEGWTTMTITTPTGEGVTSARTFVRLRRCVLVDAFRIV
jgi:hypothetical protein